MMFLKIFICITEDILMKANLPQKPKTLNDLSTASINKINNYYNDCLYKEMQEISTNCQRLMLKYFTCILHDSGVDNDTIMVYLANFRRYKRITRNAKTNEELEHILDKRISEFMQDFPTDLVDNLTQNEL